MEPEETAPRCLGKAENEAPSQPIGGWQRQERPALALQTELGGQAGRQAPPTHAPLPWRLKAALTQHVGRHPQQSV